MRQFSFLLCAAFLLATANVSAQTNDTTTQTNDTTTQTITSAQSPDATNPAPSGFLSHLDVTNFQLLGRFMHDRDSNDVLQASKLQWQLDLKANLNFDKEGNYLVHTRVSSGDVVDGGFSDTGIGYGSHPRSNLYVKRLYFQARPLKGMEFQVGSIPFFRGEATPVTHYDEGGFIIGERVTLRHPEHLYFDEITYTVGYIGATFTPNVLLRMGNFGRINYHQYLVEKHFDDRVSGSFEYSNQYLESVFREAVHVKVKELKVVDAVRAEFYQRTLVTPGNGYNVVGEKQVTKRLLLTVGFAAIDRNYVGFNNEEYNIGRHVYATGKYQFSRDWAVGFFTTRGVLTDYYLTNGRRFDVIVYYDALDAIKRSGLWRRFST
ncbi:MAG TPA: hypothetical protein V6C81_26825 [Planktothrix sp.]|jgi:hypothetical protein